MREKKAIKSIERRNFMKATGLGVGVAGAVAIGLPDAAGAAVAESGGKSGGRGYRATDHVKRFYASAKF